MSDPRLQQEFAELREFILNPAKYCDFHSTTPKGMCQFTLSLQQRIEEALTRANHAAELAEALSRLRFACGQYRMMHDCQGDGSLPAGRAWDVMKQREFEADAALAKYQAQKEVPNA